jgi:hypothetical protein
MSTTTERTHRALLLRWGERASQFHDEHPGRSYVRGEVRMPRRDLSLTANHNGPVIGIVSSFASTAEGVEAVIKLGRRGEELLDHGHVGLSPEIADDGELIGVALVVDGEPGFRSARIIESITFAATPGARVLEKPSTPAAFKAPAMLVGNASATLFGASPAAEVARARVAWRQRVESLREAEVADEEGRLLAEGIPTSRWPEYLPARQRWESFAAAQATEEAREETRRLEMELAAAVVPAPARRRWWRRNR